MIDLISIYLCFKRSSTNEISSSKLLTARCLVRKDIFQATNAIKIVKGDKRTYPKRKLNMSTLEKCALGSFNAFGLTIELVNQGN